MDADRLLQDITDLMQEAEAEAAKGGRLHKAGGSAHIKTKADHHEKMAELHAKIADSHASMSDHYKGGAKGAFKADGAGDGGDDDEADDTKKDDAKKALGGSGAYESIRGRPSRRAETLSRGEVTEMLAEFGNNFMRGLVKVLAPPTEEPAAPVETDELAAARLLAARGYKIEVPTGGPVQKRAVTLDVDTAPDKGKLGDEAARAASLASENEIEVLKAKAADGNVEARIRLEQLGREEIRNSLRNPHVATSGEVAGFRGVRVANM